MNLLLDECLPVDLRLLLPGHDVYTVTFMRWNGIKNGQLLALAASHGFDALVTNDASIEHQQNRQTLPLSVVLLDAASNEIGDVRRCVPNLLATLTWLPPRAVVHVPPP